MSEKKTIEAIEFSFPHEAEGGPAFPFSSGHITCYGMSIRDYFAAKVMSALIMCVGKEMPEGFVALNDERICERSYEIADEMLKAREA